MFFLRLEYVLPGYEKGNYRFNLERVRPLGAFKTHRFNSHVVVAFHPQWSPEFPSLRAARWDQPDDVMEQLRGRDKLRFLQVRSRTNSTSLSLG
ncbi:Na_Ca_ex domain-containing protein [Psidium guajava]|nr:Na_Ca_ex domain-containing protein [Psidium guajava]